LAALAGDRVGAEEPGVLDELRPAEALEHGVDLADVDRSAERPARSLWSARDRVEVRVQRLERVVLEPAGVLAGTALELRDDLPAAGDRRLDDRPRADDPRLLEAVGDRLERLLAGDELVEAEVRAVGRGGRAPCAAHAPGHS